MTVFLSKQTQHICHSLCSLTATVCFSSNLINHQPIWPLYVYYLNIRIKTHKSRTFFSVTYFFSRKIITQNYRNIRSFVYVCSYMVLRRTSKGIHFSNECFHKWNCFWEILPTTQNNFFCVCGLVTESNVLFNELNEFISSIILNWNTIVINNKQIYTISFNFRL